MSQNGATTSEMPKRTAQSFELMKVTELKAYLKENNQPTSGVKKDLVRLAKGTYELQILRIADGADRTTGTTANDDRDYDEDSIAKENNHVTSLRSWVTVDEVSREDWPDLTDKELYDYLVYTCKKMPDQKSKQARRQLKAHTFYDDGHVHSIGYHKSEHHDECYAKCLVIPSAASSDQTKYPDRRVWVRVSNITGRVNAAHCTCVAGLEGSCNHVAALLYAMVDITQQKKEGLDASTSKACRWKTPRKRRLSPKKSCHLHKKFRQMEAPVEPKSGVNIASFCSKLMLCAPTSGWLANYTTSKEKKEDTGSNKKMPELPKPEYMFADHVDLKSDICLEAFANFSKSVFCSQEEILETERTTREQANSDTWHNLRVGRITSSHFGEIFKRKPTTHPDGLLRGVLGYRTTPNNEHVKWGRQHEAAARRRYEIEMKKTHNIDVQVRKAGLHIHPTFPFLASSPDGVVTCHHCNPTQGLLEVKCPSQHRASKPEDACHDKTFFCHIVEGKVILKRNHNFYFQVQGQMGVCGSKWCDFVVWTTKGISVERIMFDEGLWLRMVEVLKSFYVSAVVPEVFTERVKRGRLLYAA